MVVTVGWDFRGWHGVRRHAEQSLTVAFGGYWLLQLQNKQAATEKNDPANEFFGYAGG